VLKERLSFMSWRPIAKIQRLYQNIRSFFEIWKA